MWGIGSRVWGRGRGGEATETGESENHITFFSNSQLQDTNLALQRLGNIQKTPWGELGIREGSLMRERVFLFKKD